MAKRNLARVNDNERDGDPLLSGSKRWGFTFPDAIEKKDRGYASVYGFMLQTYAKLGLKHTEFLLLLHLAWYRYESDASRGIEPSLDTIAKLMGYKDKNHRTISDMVNSLADRGFITIEARKGKTSRYDVTPFTRRALAAFVASQDDEDSATPVEKHRGEGASFTPVDDTTPVEKYIPSCDTPALLHIPTPVEKHTTPLLRSTAEEEKPKEIKKSEVGATSAEPLDGRREEPPVISSEMSPAPAPVALAPVSTMERLQAAKARLDYLEGLEPSPRDELIAALRDELGSEWAAPKFDTHINDIVDVLVGQRYRVKWVAELVEWCKKHDYKTSKEGFKPWFLTDYARKKGAELSNCEWRRIRMDTNSVRDDVRRLESELKPKPTKEEEAAFWNGLKERVSSTPLPAIGVKPKGNTAEIEQKYGRALTFDEVLFELDMKRMTANQLYEYMKAPEFKEMPSFYRTIAETVYDEKDPPF